MGMFMQTSKHNGLLQRENKYTVSIEHRQLVFFVEFSKQHSLKQILYKTGYGGIQYVSNLQ